MAKRAKNDDSKEFHDIALATKIFFLNSIMPEGNKSFKLENMFC